MPQELHENSLTLVEGSVLNTADLMEVSGGVNLVSNTHEQVLTFRSPLYLIYYPSAMLPPPVPP